MPMVFGSSQMDFSAGSSPFLGTARTVTCTGLVMDFAVRTPSLVTVA